jgi:hypothetical protein
VNIHRRHLHASAAIVAAIVISATARAQSRDTARAAHPLLSEWEAGSEFFLPANDNRTINANASLGLLLISDLRLYLFGGIM